MKKRSLSIDRLEIDSFETGIHPLSAAMVMTGTECSSGYMCTTVLTTCCPENCNTDTQDLGKR
ncbi:MAG TPA: hypothetical protein VF746_12975 [Longimicrobium sp.]|jgi:hypothetical protein